MSRHIEPGRNPSHRARDHKPDNGEKRGTGRKPEQEPAPEEVMVTLGKRAAGPIRLNREIPHFDLHPDHRQPQQSREDVEQYRDHDPLLCETISDVPCEGDIRERL